MKTKLLKLMVVSLLIAAGLYFSGALNGIGKVALVQFLRGKQGVVATVDNVALAPPLDLTITNADFSSSYKADCKLLDMEKIRVKLVFDKSKGYRLVPKNISLEGGTIFGRELATHLRLRKEGLEKQRKAAEENLTGGQRDSEVPVDNQTGSAKSESPGKEGIVRQLTLSDVTLDGGSVFVNLLIVKKEVPVKIQHIDADFMVEDDRFIINNFSWKMGPLNPSIRNREFDISLLQDPSRIKGIPKEVSGIFILAGILLGEGQSQ